MITIVFTNGPATGTTELPWIEGKQLRQYLHEYPLRQYGVGAKVFSSKFYNLQKTAVKQYYTPPDGDVIVVLRTR